MTLFLIEARKFQNSEFEPVDVIVADNAKAATEEADRRHARTTQCRKVRQWTGKLDDIEYLAKRGLKVCQGGSWCAVGSKQPHLAEIAKDDITGTATVLDELKRRQGQ